jgi:hypothetical protein
MNRYGLESEPASMPTFGASRSSKPMDFRQLIIGNKLKKYKSKKK